MNKSLYEYIFNSPTEERKEIDSRKLEQIIQEFPKDNYEAIRLFFIENKTRKQIATQLNWSISKVNNKITRGITLLKYELDRGYFKQMDQILSSGIKTSS